MNIHDESEQAYKNGYEAGVREFAERLKNVACLGEYPWDDERVYIFQSDEIANELTEGKE